MNIQVRKENANCIVVEIKAIGVYAEFQTMDDATEFIQSVIKNITSF